MKKITKRLLGGAAAAAAVGAIGALVMNRKGKSKRERKSEGDRWARPGMKVTFRAELMPGRDAAERTFQVSSLLPSGRVLLTGVAGEHTEKEFQRIR